MSTFQTYDQIGIKEDVSDIIVDITPTDVPFSTMIGAGETIANRVHQYQEDTLANAGDNKAVEGADPSMATLTATTLRSATTQILTKAFQVSATADAVATYGRAKETAYQLSKALKELKRDIEFAYIGHDNAAAAGNSSTAREMASASQLISTSVDAGSNATDALTEAKLLTLGQTCYTNGSEPSVFMIKPADAQIVAGFAASSGRNREFAQTTELVNAIDLYVSPYGEYSIVLNRHLLSTHAFLIDPTMFKPLVLRNVTRELLSKTGDSEKHFVVYEGSLKHNNFSDSGMITGLS